MAIEKALALIALKRTEQIGDISDAVEAAQAAQTAAETAQGHAEDAAEEAVATVANKADIDGYYANMTVGNAEQLISNDYVSDNAPYNFRTAGGDADIGDREYDELVGGTVAWNQLMAELSSSWRHSAGSNFTTEYSDNTVKITPTDANRALVPPAAYTPTRLANHVYFTCCYAYSTTGNRLVLYLFAGSPGQAATEATSWEFLYKITKQNVNDNGFQLQWNTYTEGMVAYFKNVMQFDLTQMFGTAIADHIYALEQANAGAGVAWFTKLFPKDYYVYNAGELMSVQAASHDMVGFNQNSVAPVIGGAWSASGVFSPNYGAHYLGSEAKIPCFPNTAYCLSVPKVSSSNGAGLTYAVFDASGNFIERVSVTNNYITASNTNITFTTPDNCYYFGWYIYRQTDFTAAELEDICINLSWSGYRNGEYEPYEKHSYPLDASLTLRGIPKLDASNNLVYDGDTYEADGTVTRRYGIVDLGDGTWVNNIIADEPSVFCRTTTINRASTANYLCAKYVTNNTYAGALQDKQIGFRNSSNYQQIVIKDTAYTDAATFKAAMAGVYLVYELATPSTETADAFQTPQIVNDFGTEQYVDAAVAAGTRDVTIPVGHDTKYFANLVDKLRRLPDAPDTAGDYLVHYDSTTRRASYTAYIGPTELPDAPASDGTYTLKATVADGEVTYFWEA